jgi:hypothetical protein
MKKIILACLLCASIGLFAGCSKSSTSDSTQQAPATPDAPPPAATHSNAPAPAN